MTARRDLSDGPHVSTVDYRGSYTIEPKRRSALRWIVRIGVVGSALLLVASLFLANMCGAREPANRIKCANNLRQIGLASIMYANDHGSAFPATIQILAASEDLGNSVFYCPSDRSKSPPANGQTLANPINANSEISYVYVGDRVRSDVDDPATAVIAFEPLSNHDNDGMKVHAEALADHSGDGMNVCFADAHVEWISAPEAVAILKQAVAAVRPIRVSADLPNRQLPNADK